MILQKNRVILFLFLIFSINFLSFADNLDKNKNIIENENSFGLQTQIFTKVKSLKPNPSKIFSTMLNYKVTPGDIFKLTIKMNVNAMTNSSSSVNSYPLQLQSDYTFDIPIIGKVSVKGKSLQEIQELIPRKLKYAVPVQYVNFSLEIPAQYDIFIYGGVLFAGYTPAMPMSTLLDMIAASGGFKPGASYRNIKITKKDGSEKYYDVAKFYTEGDLESNPFIEPEDKIFIPRADIITSISGSIYSPGKYEMKKGETLKDLILFSGGFLPGASKSIIEYSSLNEDGSRNLSTLNFQECESIKVKMGDIVNIRSKSESLPMVTIEGAVFGDASRKSKSVVISPIKPVRLDFSYTSGITALKLLDLVGGPTPYAIQDSAFILKKNSLDKIKVDVEKLWETRNLELDVKLNPGDTLVIPMESLVVFVGGEVNKPNAIVYSSSMTAMDYIIMAGGFTLNADRNKIFELDESGKKIEIELNSIVKPGTTLYIEKNFAALSDEVFKDVMIYTSFVSSLVATASGIMSLAINIRNYVR